MSKAVRVYSGRDSYGRSVQVAERVDGKWFSRFYEWNGYHSTWSRWKPHETPVHPSRVKFATECSNAPEYYEIPEDKRANMIEWGFNNLSIVPGPHRLRLPNE
ncbi:hypothetical protein [Cronobacter sakazakii]|uniref:hypothetical protein n=1 Tax=Cronobacter sakazakii TaxID=28141 RepID=UPI000F5CBC7A|nr:hypothetical protein [Cronobacter sakazakii]MDK1225389.1 hypothetical protein [Cronobacter turicensis]EMC4401916.1 hypothetical protein [Cronobacter sakazakii]KAB0805737.1 hypothetical protein FZI15_22400 [Cronobacter sakazakii]KAB0886836.1 hypothetical protein FZI07_21605 [Cronobacter sakazakii]KAB0900864.1 hypothetical protein FZI05_19600 [Cronobacter sakazakii]